MHAPGGQGRVQNISRKTSLWKSIKLWSGFFSVAWVLAGRKGYSRMRKKYENALRKKYTEWTYLSDWAPCPN